jgi:integrase
VESICVLSQEEIRKVLHRLHFRGRHARTPSQQINLVIFRLSCCCGLRVKELTGLRIKDVVTESEKPFVHVHKGITKGQEGKRRGRFVPLSWDSGTRADLRAWKKRRIEVDGASLTDPFLCNLKGGPLSIRSAQHRWEAFTRRILGEDRNSSIHDGRHTFCTHSLYNGRSIMAVAKAAGHAKIDTTAEYLHAVEELEKRGLPDVFSY